MAAPSAPENVPRAVLQHLQRPELLKEGSLEEERRSFLTGLKSLLGEWAAERPLNSPFVTLLFVSDSVTDVWDLDCRTQIHILNF